MKLKILSAIFLSIVLLNLSNAQDDVSWAYKIKFKIDAKSSDSWRTGNYNFEDLELFLNETEHFQNFRDCNLEFYSSTNEYILQLNYSCISCGYEFKSPIELYLKVNLSDKYSSNTKFSTIISIYFEELENYDNYTTIYDDDPKIADIGTINIIDFIEGKYDDKTKKLIKPFSVINVKSDLSVHKIRTDKTRKMDKLILLKNNLK